MDSKRVQRLIWWWALLSGLVHVTWELGWCLNHARMTSPEAEHGLLRVFWLYAIADRRYMFSDPFAVSLEWLTVLVVTPMNFYVVWAIGKGRIRPAALVTLVFSTMELYGAVLYFAAEGVTGWAHLSADPIDRWFKVAFLNGIWLVVPSLCIWAATRTLLGPAPARERARAAALTPVEG